MIKLGIANAKRAKGDRVAIFAMRSSASFISPKIFDEISFPSLKRMVEGYHAAGLTSVLHCDGNWDLMIPRFLELPKASCVVELDGATNIRKAAKCSRATCASRATSITRCWRWAPPRR